MYASHDLPVQYAHFVIMLVSLGSHHQRYNEVAAYWKNPVPYSNDGSSTALHLPRHSRIAAT